MGKPLILSPADLQAMQRLGTLGRKVLHLVEAETLAYMADEISRLRFLLLQQIPDNWYENDHDREALTHLAAQGVQEAQTKIAQAMGPKATAPLDAPTFPPIEIRRQDSNVVPQESIEALMRRTINVLDRRTPKTTRQIAVELGAPDRVDLLAALGQLCADGLAIREPGTGVYLARTSPCA